MRVGMVTKEYPPEVYGGAGVHVEFLVRELRRKMSVDVHCFGAPREETGVYAYEPDSSFEMANPAIQTFDVDMEIAARLGNVDLIHTHTWYANLAGVIAGKLNETPHVITAHSLEPMRPWKAEQLRGGYRLSSWVESQAYRTADAIIAVSQGMKTDILQAYPFVDPEQIHVIYNGIDSAMYRPVFSNETLTRYHLDPDRPIVIFVGRITKQKGVMHLLKAAEHFTPGVQLVLCAGAPDNPQIAEKVEEAVMGLRRNRADVVWIEEMLPREELIPLISHATVFVCPSIYEPLGIVNLEAMACGTAVVASDVGGIPEVVEDGVTGTLVHYGPSDPDEGDDAESKAESKSQAQAEPGAEQRELSAEEIAEFEQGIADAVNHLAANPDIAQEMGKAGRKRAVDNFSWGKIANQTNDLYKSLLNKK